jgi:hypothetical protein
MAQAADSGWRVVSVTCAAAALTLTARLSPIWLPISTAVLGGFGLVRVESPASPGLGISEMRISAPAHFR